MLDARVCTFHVDTAIPKLLTASLGRPLRGGCREPSHATAWCLLGMRTSPSMGGANPTGLGTLYPSILRGRTATTGTAFCPSGSRKWTSRPTTVHAASRGMSKDVDGAFLGVSWRQSHKTPVPFPSWQSCTICRGSTTVKSPHLRGKGNRSTEALGWASDGLRFLASASLEFATSSLSGYNRHCPKRLAGRRLGWLLDGLECRHGPARGQYCLKLYN